VLDLTFLLTLYRGGPAPLPAANIRRIIVFPTPDFVGCGISGEGHSGAISDYPLLSRFVLIGWEFPRLCRGGSWKQMKLLR
jgi:hypothetical protein